MSCFISNLNEFEVRSSVVFHDGQDPAEPIGVVNFGFSEDDRVALYMDGDLTALVHERHRAANRQSAERIAARWVGKDGEPVEFRYIPGVYVVCAF
jgi:hypothetical protein